ncbi:MAG: hypothetical protein M3040_01205, partial [Bacteroidota bacterium]|nr:hypothetical protein [Bacteroidota bacterium]
MRSYKSPHIYSYILSDLFASTAAWWIFTCYRRNLLHEAQTGLLDMTRDRFFNTSLVAIPIAWACFFLLTGFYREPLYKRSRLNELTAAFIACLIGCLLLFFLIILNDHAPSYTYFYKTFFLFFALQFGLTSTSRFFILAKIKSDLLTGRLR